LKKTDHISSFSLINTTLKKFTEEDTVLVDKGDLNGHVGAAKDGYSCHGYGSRNADGERILEYADSHDLTIVNTKFRKRDSHLISFYSGNAKTQIDYVLVRRRDQGLATDAKTVPYETVATQHRPLICSLKITCPRCKRVERCETARIKWWRLKEKEAAVISRHLIADGNNCRRNLERGLREARLRWYGHVLRANDDTVCKIGLNLKVPGKRPRGRPKQRWLDALRLDLKMAGVHPDQAFRENHTRRADPATKREKRYRK
uniref:Endo/exonuclease/phosphatase domain-containing protein n=1 Tax=Heligmosomoides polygyrus TaxID=6339 RepID=A0A183GT88_HELPZ